MTRKIAYGHLLQLYDEAEAGQGTLLHLILRKEIEKIVLNNKPRLTTILQKRKELWQQFFEIENDQIRRVKLEGSDKETPVLLPGKSMDDYAKAYNRLINTMDFVELP